MTNLPAKGESGNWHNLADESPKDGKWDGHRGRAQDLAAMLGEGWEADAKRAADRITDCSTWLEMEITADRETGEAGLRLSRASFCRWRHCPVCQWRRSLMWKARFLEAIADIDKRPEAETAQWVMLTLTVRNCPITELRERLAAMSKAWKRLSMRKEVEPAMGGWIRATEITRGKDGTAHPHYHVLLAVKPSYFGKRYIPAKRWAELWQQAMRLDYTPIVDIRRVKPRGEQTGVAAGAAEVLKYATKTSDLLADRAWTLELIKQVRNTRAIAAGGWLKDALRVEDESQQDLIEGEGDDDQGDALGVVRYGWHKEVKRYRRKRQPPSAQP